MSGPAVGILKMANGKWEVASGKFRNCVAIIKMTDASSQMPEASQGIKFKDLRSLSLFFRETKKEGGPTFNKLKIKG